MENENKTFITVLLPCYNEEAILDSHVKKIQSYLKERASKYLWEILIINDGSKDKTGEIANALAEIINTVKVIHHPTNFNLGKALQTGFCNSKGEIIVVLDIDLSYAVEHIDLMVDKLIETTSDVVVASPYMKGGKVTAVPFFREAMSKIVNRFMRLAAQDKYYTFTGMVRAYRAEFIKTVNLKTTGL